MNDPSSSGVELMTEMIIAIYYEVNVVLHYTPKISGFTNSHPLQS